MPAAPVSLSACDSGPLLAQSARLRCAGRLAPCNVPTLCGVDVSMIRFIRLILNHRALVLALLALTLGCSMLSARTIRLRFQFRDFYDNSRTPIGRLFKADSEEFGDPAGYVIALIEADDVFQPEVLDYVQKLTSALEPDKAFARVRSLTNARAIRGQGDDLLTGPLRAQFPNSVQGLRDFRAFAVDSPLVRRRLVSRDAKSAAVLAEMRTPAAFATVAQQRAAIAVLERALGKIARPSGVGVRVTGAPSVDVGVTDALISDQLLLVPAVVAALGLMLLLSFYSVHGILLCLATVGTATVWTAGLFALLDRPVDLIGSVIPITILVYGVVDPIFVLARVLDKLDEGVPKSDAIPLALSELSLPCFLTSVTTALGFAAFMTASQPTIRYYGATVAAGVLLAWLTSITVLPILLSFFPVPKRRFRAARVTAQLDRTLQGLWGALRGRMTQALVVTVLLLLVGGYFARAQRVDNVYVGGLPNGSTQADVHRLEQRLAGVLSLSVHLEGSRDVMKQPELLRRLERVDREMERQPLVTVSSSLADLVAEANQAFQGGDVAERRVPASRALVAQYLTLIDPADRSRFVSDDYSQSQLALLVVDPGSERMRSVTAELRRVIKQADFGALGVSATVTGKGVVGYDAVDQAVSELLVGFVTAFSAIVALTWVVFRSIRIALISILPNLLPVVACFLTLRLWGIGLRVDTALVLCISVGGLFNTTIHFAARVKQLAERGELEPDAVILRAMRSVGPPALFTACALSVGFAVLLLSSFPGLRALGLLTMVTLGTGFFADMIVTAVLLRLGFDWRSSPAVLAGERAALPAIQTRFE